MPRNGSGTYSAPTTSWSPAVDGNSATTADFNTLRADMEAALSQSIASDGQTPITGNLPMSGYKLTGLGTGSASGNSLAWQQLFSQGTEADIASASTCDIGAQNTNFLRVTGTTTITSFGTSYNGPRFLRFEGILTLTHNSTTLVLPTGASITTAAGDTAIAVPKASAGTANGWVVYYQRASGQALVSATVPDASDTVKGIVELATTAEAAAGTDTVRAVTPAGLAARTPNASTSAVGLVELATDAEAQAGTDTARALTASNLVAAKIITSSTVATTSGTSIDFTGIPSWAKRITVCFNSVSLSGAAHFLVQIGDGSVATTGYVSTCGTLSGSPTTVSSTSGFVIYGGASSAMSGHLVLTNMGSNTWICSHVVKADSSNGRAGAGDKALSGSLDRVRITSTNGTDTFDAGSASVMWE